jgi:hypothetical protein
LAIFYLKINKNKINDIIKNNLNLKVKKMAKIIAKKRFYTDDKVELINMIADESEKLVDEKFNLEKIIFDKKSIETDVMADIVSAVDEKGKPLYSNVEKRDTELKNRLSENIGYDKIKNLIDTKKNEIEKQTIKIEYLKNLFKILLEKNEL